MTQNIQNFLQDCTTVTADGSLTTLDEVEGLYVHWCSLRGQDTAAESLVQELIALDGVESVMHDGVDCVEGIVLTGPVVADFILTCEFAGAWGHAEPVEFEAFARVASAS